MKKYFIMTFGCQMNYADSEKVNMLLLQSGFMSTKDWKDADLIIFNTCSVRKKWEDRVFGMYEEIQKEKERLAKLGIWKRFVIWITGCMVRKSWVNEKYFDATLKKRERAKKIEYVSEENALLNNDDKLFPRMPNLDFVFRIEEVNYLNKILSTIFDEQIWSDHKFDDYLKAKQLRENPASASVIIQKWCDNFCTFCIVPYTRDREISREKIDIINEIKDAVNSWATEVTLLGQNVNSYGKQFHKSHWNEEKSAWNSGIWKSPFRELLEEVSNIDWINRIRFTSSNPHDMIDDILDAHFELPNMCNYIHFALQSGNDEILKKMNRRHKYEEFKRIVKYLREKDPLFSISTDIIVWFSGETEEQFQDTVRAIEELEFDFVYIARYSVRTGTIASKIYQDDVTSEEKARRWHILNWILEKNVAKRNALMLGRIEEILISGIKWDEFVWRTRNFKEVQFSHSKNYKVWDTIKVKITSLDKWVLKWEIVNN